MKAVPIFIKKFLGILFARLMQIKLFAFWRISRALLTRGIFIFPRIFFLYEKSLREK